MPRPDQAADLGRRSYDFRAPIEPTSALATEPLLVRLADTRAFRRLRTVRFLGAIDYLRVPTPNGKPGSRRYTRHQHSLGVARLALLYCQLKQIAGDERLLILCAALLHDIGHAPLSHSLEPLFKQQFGMDHHKATEALVTGQAALGREVHAALREARVDVERLVAVIGGRDPGHDGFFSGPINFDTIEGILRTQTYEKPAPRASSPDTVVTAALNRTDDDDRIAVDDFWLYKDLVYRFIINSEAGLLADAVCQSFMRRHLHKFGPDDVFRSEVALFRQLPGLRQLLTSPDFTQRARQELGSAVSFKARRFTVDPAGDFFMREDKLRYQQIKTDSRLDIDDRDPLADRELSMDLFDDDARD